MHISVTVSGVCDGHILVYSETHIDVFEVASGEWIQTLNLRRSKPLTRSGVLNMVMMSDLPHVAYLKNIQQGESAVNCWCIDHLAES